MLTVILKILGILGILLLVLLGVVLTVILLVLFVPVVYRVEACRKPDPGTGLSGEDSGGAVIRVAARLNWMFGLVRARYFYPDPGTFTVKALFFTLFEYGREDDDAQTQADPKKARKKKSAKGSSQKEESKKEESKKEKSKKENFKEENSKEGNLKKGRAEKEASERENSENENLENENGKEQSSGKVDSQKSDSQKVVSQKVESQKIESQKVESKKVELQKVGSQKEAPENAGAQKEKSSTQHTQDAHPQDGPVMSERGNDGESIKTESVREERRNPFEKLMYTIRQICDRIKRIRENIAHYKAILLAEDTKGLVNHAFMRLGRILKSIRPRKLKADILFGTGSPDTTGYVFGIYGMLCASLGERVLLTPDFERAVLEGELYAAGHITVFRLLWNGLFIALDKRLWELIDKLKEEDN